MISCSMIPLDKHFMPSELRPSLPVLNVTESRTCVLVPPYASVLAVTLGVKIYRVLTLISESPSFGARYIFVRPSSFVLRSTNMGIVKFGAWGLGVVALYFVWLIAEG